VREALEEPECEGREVTPLLRVRVAGLSSALEGGEQQGERGVREAILSIWRPSEDQVRVHPFWITLGPESGLQVFLYASEEGEEEGEQ